MNEIVYLELHRLGLEIFETEKFTLFINLKSLLTFILDVLTFFSNFSKHYLVFMRRKDLSIISYFISQLIKFE